MLFINSLFKLFRHLRYWLYNQRSRYTGGLDLQNNKNQYCYSISNRKFWIKYQKHSLKTVLFSNVQIDNPKKLGALAGFEPSLEIRADWNVFTNGTLGSQASSITSPILEKQTSTCYGEKLEFVVEGSRRFWTLYPKPCLIGRVWKFSKPYAQSYICQSAYVFYVFSFHDFATTKTTRRDAVVLEVRRGVGVFLADIAVCWKTASRKTERKGDK